MEAPNQKLILIENHNIFTKQTKGLKNGKFKFIERNYC